nr:DUF362 domain-containing protein [Maliibacterium massiliense]
MRDDQIAVLYGADAHKMGYDIMQYADIAARLKPGMHIALKPNLVVGKPASSGATTTTALVEGVIDYLQAHGFDNITIMESSWVGDSTKRAYKVCGYEDLARRKGVGLLDLKNDSTHEVGGIAVCDAPIKADFLINLPVLKGHCQTVMTCALKNMKGCIPDREKRKFHTLGLHRPIAELSRILRPDVTIVDGLNGDLNFEEGGNPVPMNRVFLGFDPVKIDAYACRLMGIDVADVHYIGLAEKLGSGSARIDADSVIDINQDTYQGKRPVTSRSAQRLAKYIAEDQACSACYGSLIHALYRLDEMGQLHRIKQKICIGQGYKGKDLDGCVGVGNCTRGCARHVGGCPPRADKIMEMLLGK